MLAGFDRVPSARRARMCRCHVSITSSCAVRTATPASERNAFFQPKYAVMRATGSPEGQPGRQPASPMIPEIYAHAPSKVRVGPGQQQSGPRHQKHGCRLAGVARQAGRTRHSGLGPIERRRVDPAKERAGRPREGGRQPAIDGTDHVLTLREVHYDPRPEDQFWAAQRSNG